MKLASGRFDDLTSLLKETMHRVTRLLTSRKRAVLIPVVGGSLLWMYSAQRSSTDAASGQTAIAVKPWKPWQVNLMRCLPLRTASRWWGELNQLTIPVCLRRPVLGFLTSYIGCDMSEAVETDFRSYRCVGDLFCRAIRPALRPVAADCLVSPVDGQVTEFGEVKDGKLPQVKGITYDLQRFIGGRIESTETTNNENGKSRLYMCVVYLSFADYHGLHSPFDFDIQQRTHFIGELFGIGRIFEKRIPGVFAENERVLMSGRWPHGYASFTAVGGPSVGSVRLQFDDELKTNQKGDPVPSKRVKDYQETVRLRKGDKIGHFNFGSSVVILFEAPANFDFKVKRGQKIKYGETIGDVPLTDGLR